MLRAKPLSPRKPRPGDIVCDGKGREYRVRTIGTKLVYAVSLEDGKEYRFGVRDVYLKVMTGQPEQLKLSLDEEFLD